MAAHLTGSKINLALLRETYRKELLNSLDQCTGTKAVVWDDTLTGPFGLIAEYSLLKEHEVDKMYSLKSGGLPASTVQNIIFIVRPKLQNMDIIAQNILKEEEMGNLRKEFHIIFVPRKSLLCEKKLKELGVYGALTNILEFCLDLIPFDSDLLSMEMDNCYKDCILYNDNTVLFHAAKSIMSLQALYGIIPSIYGKGECAKLVSDMIIHMRRQLASQEIQVPSQIDTLLLIDRDVDPLTPLLSQLTFEGLIDDIFTINNTSVRLPADKFTKSSPDGQQQQQPSSSSETKKVILNSGEELYAEIRDRNFNAVGPILSRKAKLISAQFDERLAAKTVGEMKTFVSKLPHIQAAKQSLATHTTIAELLKEVTDTDDFLECLRVQQEFINGIDTDKAHPFIEDCIAKQDPLNKVLKLVCIQSITNNGLKAKLLDYYRREIIQTYGFQHLLTLMNLEKAGLLKVQGQRTYPTIRKTMKLVVEDVHEQRPNDISYVFSGFAPLSVRLAQFLARPGWRSIEEVLNMLPGPKTHRVQQVVEGLRKRRNSTSSSHSSSAQEQSVTLIFFLGGITYAEIAALRFLSQAEDGPTEYLIATTKIINSDSFLGALKEELTPPQGNPFY